MARRRSSSPSVNPSWIVALVVVGVIVSVAESHPGGFAAFVVVLLGGGVWWWMRKRRSEQQAREAAAAAIEEGKRWWRELPFPPGTCTVMLTSVRYDDGRLYGFLENLSQNPAFAIDAHSLLQRAEHIGPQPVIADISENFAVELKVALEDRGAKVKITEAVVATGNGRRQPIPERVRNEVWRRDGGSCVDCGSRERLEYDHIVPVSKGGANTARNIELRCEPCNRKKGAKT